MKSIITIQHTQSIHHINGMVGSWSYFECLAVWRHNFMGDILFRTDSCIFSYRAAGIFIQEGRVLLQKPADSGDYAFPGGQIAFGETSTETLIREYKEEVDVDIEVGELKWVEENFFQWGGRLCHQVSLSYTVKPADERQIPLNGRFISREYKEGDNSEVYFYWVPLNEVRNISVYPVNAAELLLCLNEGVKHFIHREDNRK